MLAALAEQDDLMVVPESASSAMLAPQFYRKQTGCLSDLLIKLTSRIVVGYTCTQMTIYSHYDVGIIFNSYIPYNIYNIYGC